MTIDEVTNDIIVLGNQHQWFIKLYDAFGLTIEDYIFNDSNFTITIEGSVIEFLKEPIRNGDTEQQEMIINQLLEAINSQIDESSNYIIQVNIFGKEYTL